MYAFCQICYSCFCLKELLPRDRIDINTTESIFLILVLGGGGGGGGGGGVEWEETGESYVFFSNESSLAKIEDNFHFQNNHPKGRKTTSSHLNRHADCTSHLKATLQMLNSF